MWKSFTRSIILPEKRSGPSVGHTSCKQALKQRRTEERLHPLAANSEMKGFLELIEAHIQQSLTGDRRCYKKVCITSRTMQDQFLTCPKKER
jgi:hypothetical protein